MSAMESTRIQRPEASEAFFLCHPEVSEAKLKDLGCA
jgi:hypothetical protein